MNAIERVCSFGSLFVVALAGCGESGNGSDRNGAEIDSAIEDTASEHETAAVSDDAGPTNPADDDIGSTDDPVGEAWPDNKYISMATVYEKSTQPNSDMLLINVSDEEFYAMGHIAGSLKIPWDSMGENLDAVDAERHIVIYCRRGVRSESAYDTLTVTGYAAVWVMEGGLEAWIDSGYPVVFD
jgi:rhodanese-related sulfurtransferase